MKRSAKSLAAEAAFRTRIAELGGSVLEPAWLGVDAHYRVQCAAGHTCAPRASHVLGGAGICRSCAGNDPAQAERVFRARVAELGGVVLESAWLGAQAPHRILCPAGHECSPRPVHIRRGNGLCKTCAKQSPAEADRLFRARVAELGGVVLESAWLGAKTPHRILCPAGHECSPQPNSIQQGNGLCRKCRGLAWNVFYVVTNDASARVKFGITSNDSRSRLAVHRKAGYRTVVRLLTDLPGTVAPDMERLTISTLRLAGETPVRGREYFGVHVLGTVLDIIDHYPITAIRPTTESQKGSQRR